MDHFSSSVSFGKSSSRHFVSAFSEQERTIVLAVHDYYRGWNCKSLLLSFPLIFSFERRRFPVRTLDQYPCLNLFFSNSEVSCSDRLFNVSSHHNLPSLIAWHRSISINFLVAQCQYSLKMNRLSNLHFAQTFQGIFLRYFTGR